MELGKLPTEEAAIDEALRQFIQFRKQPKISEHFDATEIDPQKNFKE